MRLDDALRDGARRLAEGGIEGAARDARLLLAEAAGLAPDRLTLERDRALGPEEAAAFEGYLARRLAHEPVSRILGRRAFWGKDFIVTPAVLDPRPETETLVAAALEGPRPRRLLDLGTGSGAIVVSLLAQWPDTMAIATDISPEALAVAQSNAEIHGVADRLAFVETDWFSGIDGMFELIVSNPPYIAAEEMAGLAPEVRGHDPEGALTPGGDGLDAYRAITAGLAGRLAPGGRLLVEIGPTQGQAVAALFAEAGLIEVALLDDLDGRDRVVSGLAP